MDDTNRMLIDGWTGGAFLSENPEAYGMVSDAHPLAVGNLMLAVSGYTPEDGMHPPTFTVNSKGVTGLYESLYHSLITTGELNDSLLRLTFGESEGRQTHPLARYSAVLTQVLAYEILRAEVDDSGEEMTPDAYAAEMTRRLPWAIDELRDIIREETGPRPGSERFFSVSLGACRVTEAGEGTYHIDLFTAGDYSLYLLDRQGMRPLWNRATDLLMGDETSCVHAHRLTVEHPDPFALLLLSRSACEPSPADQRSMVDRPGLLWRHRMRLEDQYIRLLTSGADLAEVSEKAAHLLAGRCPGWDSVSGAVMICGGSFAAFKSHCPERLTELENLIALFPEGYDPDEEIEPVLRETVERNFILEAFRTRPRIPEKTVEVLSQYATDLLRGGEAASPEPVGPDGIRRLTYAEVLSVYQSFDEENTEDRRRIEANSRLIRELLAEHWLTLRPLLLQGRPDTAEGAAAYAACVRLRKQVSRLTAYRRKQLDRVKKQLSDSLDILEFQGEDWIRGRGGDVGMSAWLEGISEGLPRLSMEAGREWTALSERLRSLQTAYTLERDKLFFMDATCETGAWYDTYGRILNGTLPSDAWLRYGEAVREGAPGFAELLQMAEALSKRNGVLSATIEGRAAERRAIRALCKEEEWQIACLLGSLCEDEAWGEACLQMIDSGFRSEYKAAIRRWQEENELINRQKETFGIYRAMYETYGRS